VSSVGGGPYLFFKDLDGYEVEIVFEFPNLFIRGQQK